MNENDHASKIRTLNDTFRKTGRGGRIMLTQGIQALGQKAVAEIIAKVRAFDQFNEGNDPYLEHDFGKVVHGKETVLWKISYYDRAMEFGSPDQKDPAVTTRVMTVMLGEEY